MKRRTFIGSTAAAMALPLLPQKIFAFPQNNKILKPQALQQGDTVGIIAPGTAVSDPDMIAKAKEALNYFGLNVKFGNHMLKGSGYLSRTSDERVEDLHQAFLDKEIKAVFCMRGGYASMHLLDKIDYEIISKNPKIFLGYSDITALHLAINKMTGLVTFHGPVMISGFSKYTEEYFKKALFSNSGIGVISNPKTQNNFRQNHPIRTINPGTAKGKLIGGNLTLVASTLGTPYEIETKGKLLFLEDVGEEPYRIDRMLTHLHLANKLETAAGIIFGECSDCNYDDLKPSRVSDYSLGEVLDNILGKLNIPVFYGLTIGHTDDQATLPIGVEAEMDGEKGTLNILESGVI
ncbi:MAG: LD-carboxypeptidase [FCB group bacterium]|jgi:muramoyltetrapeptide carboxypeptidase